MNSRPSANFDKLSLKTLQSRLSDLFKCFKEMQRSSVIRSSSMAKDMNLESRLEEVITIAESLCLDILPLQNAKDALINLCNDTLDSNKEINFWNYLQDNIIDKIWNFNYHNVGNALKRYNKVQPELIETDNNTTEQSPLQNQDDIKIDIEGRPPIYSLEVEPGCLYYVTTKVSYEKNFYKEALLPLKLASNTMNQLIENTCDGKKAREAYNIESWADKKMKFFGGLYYGTGSALGFVGGFASGIGILRAGAGDMPLAFQVGMGSILGTVIGCIDVIFFISFSGCLIERKCASSLEDIIYTGDLETVKSIREQLKHPVLFFDKPKELPGKNDEQLEEKLSLDKKVMIN